MSVMDGFREITPAELADLWRRQSTSYQHIPEPLTPQQRFRLVEIAHETKDDAVKTAALTLLMPEPVLKVSRP